MCRLSDLKSKEVINVETGRRMGFVCDIEFSLENGKFTALIVPGQRKFRLFFSKPEDIYLKWENIVKIGDDIILVNFKEL
jgi:YlmC/YmxH family sporulation protein